MSILKNLPSRVLFIFLSAILLLFLINMLGFHLFLNSKEVQFNKNTLEDYATLIQEKFVEEGEIDSMAFKSFFTTIDRKVHLWSKGKFQWTNQPHLPPPMDEQPQLERSWQWHHGRLFLHINNQNFNLTLGSPHHFPPPPKHKLWFLLTLSLVIGYCYWALRKIFAPLNDLELASQAWSKGNFQHRLPSNYRNEQWKNLLHSFNQMAVQLEDQFNQKRNLFLAMGHELRTPLTRMALSLELLEPSHLRSQLQNDQKEMKDLVEGLLLSEQINHFNTKRETFDFIKLLNKTINTKFPTTKRHFPNQAFVEGQPTFAEILIINLLNNATKISESVSCTFTKGERLWKFEVSDQGPGIAEEHLSKITDAFYRVDQSRDRKTGGLGLGLYLVHQICKSFSWELEINSTVGKGTIITISGQIAPQ